jgi:3-carboxy-cis,cis-muconate cycloisomerase
VPALVDDAAWLAAMLEVEAALARAGAREGVISGDAARRVQEAARPEAFDLAELGRAGGEAASPVVPLARLLRERAGEDAHRGATSQDVLDTAMMLVARRALAVITEDAAAAADAAAALARAHRDTPVSGRTLLQRAVPTSFGLKAANWLIAIEEALALLVAVRETGLAVQLGGPVGHGSPALAADVADELGLVHPVLPWHTNRVRVAGLAAALGVLAGVLAKVARDVTLLAQAEVAEAREGGDAAGPDRGSSSAMPHKRNPVAAVSVLACAHRAPGLVATVLAGMPQEHERAAGAWQAEWGTVSELLTLTGSAAAWSRELLEGLEVDPERMRAGVGDADPDLGCAGELIDRALIAHRAAGR